jgi:hypothetical protein
MVIHEVHIHNFLSQKLIALLPFPSLLLLNERDVLYFPSIVIRGTDKLPPAKVMAEDEGTGLCR